MNDEPQIGDRIAASIQTLAYRCGDKFGEIEERDGDIFLVRMERSRKLVPFGREQFELRRERGPGQGAR